MAAKQFEKQFGVQATTTINKVTKLPPIKEDVLSLKLRIQEVSLFNPEQFLYFLTINLKLFNSLFKARI